MTENAFYPLFLAAALQLVLVLERPTLWRQLGLLASVGLLFATRVQAVAFLPAIVVAPALVALLGRRPLLATLDRYRVLYGTLAGGALLVLVAQLARGRSLSDLLGAYAVVGDRSTTRRRGTVLRSTTWPSSISTSASCPFAALSCC